MRLPILLHPDDKLRKVAEEVPYMTDELIDLLDNMYETMLAHDGIGIAAPQVGRNLRIAVVEIEEGDRFDLINPEIIEKKGETIDVEGCLSIPETFGTVKRADEITIRYYDREGDQMEVTAYGYLARCFQHEIDHLDGKLFIDQMIEKIAPADLEKYMEEHEDD
ncbi:MULTISPECIES: peptide deformylase [Enterococcus]|uniref:Peptide deformylase n=1 Tax=Enterococcus alishanensis TaxID=1303817 RepID=A0ABS6TFT4_9ENTE|nr:peptide deformylase [Enterococcus alishanensis]MBV7391765.1 peptide deformylase [Enterococcus alishanensis]